VSAGAAAKAWAGTRTAAAFGWTTRASMRCIRMHATGHGAPCHACVQSVQRARKRCSAASGHRAARRTQHRLANNAGRTGAASPALASDTSLLLHRRWHCQTQHAAHGYTTKQARLAFRLQSACRRMLASGSI
jgi:hypothetical protein